MDGWMNEWMDEWMNKWMNEWIDEWMNEWMGGWMTFGGRLRLTICWAIVQIFDFSGTTEIDYLLVDFSDVSLVRDD